MTFHREKIVSLVGQCSRCHIALIPMNQNVNTNNFQFDTSDKYTIIKSK